MQAQSTDTVHSVSTFSESSKTDSSKTEDSEDKDSDLTRDNAASPIDLECKIQMERITKVLDEALYKTKLALCLPGLVQEYLTLNQTITAQHMEELTYIFEQYDNPLFSSSLMNLSGIDESKSSGQSIKNRFNPELAHLLYILNGYTSLRPIVDEMVTVMKSTYSRSENKPMPSGLEYLLTFEKFRMLMIKQMEATAEEELTAKLDTKRLEASNEKLLKSIQEYMDTLTMENDVFEGTMKTKKDTVERLEKELAILKQDADAKLKRKILDSERQMVIATRAHLVKKEMLKEEEVESRELYENVLRSHLIDEKNLRARRFKVETQLLSWLQKYDLEMGDKQLEMDEFTAKYDDEVKKCEELDLKIAEQDKEYIPLMEEREKEYHQEMTEKMNKFLVEHAARVIQCAWRDVLANRAEKKKLKKLLKKMQAAAAAAEAAAQAAAAAERRAAARAAAEQKKEEAAAKKKK